MEINLLFKGLAIGFSIAAPVGVIGLLCINRTLEQGSLAGLVSGLGAATADGIYGGVAGFGLTFIADFLIEQQLWLRFLGGIFLFYLGIKIFISEPVNTEIAGDNSSLINAYLSTLVLTLTNPLTIFSFLAIFAGLGLANSNTDYLSATVMVLGVFLGSACWWLILSSTVSLVRKKINSRILRLLNRVCGTIIIAFGMTAILSMRKL